MNNNVWNENESKLAIYRFPLTDNVELNRHAKFILTYMPPTQMRIQVKSE